MKITHENNKKYAYVIKMDFNFFMTCYFTFMNEKIKHVTLETKKGTPMLVYIVYTSIMYQLVFCRNKFKNMKNHS